MLLSSNRMRLLTSQKQKAVQRAMVRTLASLRNSGHSLPQENNSGRVVVKAAESVPGTLRPGDDAYPIQPVVDSFGAQGRSSSRTLATTLMYGTSVAILGWAMLHAVHPSTLASNLWSMYLSALKVHPTTTKICTGLVGTFLGDFIAQALPSVMAKVKSLVQTPQQQEQETEIHNFNYDFMRAARFLVYSGLVATPAALVWYNLLDRVISPGNATAMSTVVTKVALDQLLFSPLMTAVFFAVMVAAEGQAHKAGAVIRAKLLPTLKANYLLWPAAHCVNFAFVPSELRILYINVVSIGWAVFLSSMANAKDQPEHDKDNSAHQQDTDSMQDQDKKQM